MRYTCSIWRPSPICTNLWSRPLRPLSYLPPIEDAALFGELCQSFFFLFVRFITFFLISCSGTTDIVSPHGIPLDLLDRLLIIRTLLYSTSDMEQIIKLRAQTEGLQLEENAFSRLSEIGTSSTLRYAVQLLTPAHQMCKVNGRNQISKEDIEDVHSLFLDAKRSSKHLSEKNNKFML